MSIIGRNYKKATAFRDFKKNEAPKEVDKKDPQDAPVSLKSLKVVLAYIDKVFIDLNYRLKHTSLSASFDCEVISVTIPATSSLKIGHNLKTIPKYRLILRQTGGGVIRDIVSADDWNEYYITLRNDGATEVNLTVGVYKE